MPDQPLKRDQMETLLLVPLDDSVVFPGMTVTLALDLGEESRVLLVPRDSAGEFASVGTVAEVVDGIQLPGGVRAFGRSVTELGTLADTSGSSPDLSHEDKVDLLETLDVTERLEKALKLQ